MPATVSEWTAIMLALVAIGGMGLQWWNNRNGEKKSGIEYWEKVAKDLRSEIALIKADVNDDRAENARWRKRATKAFDYLCNRAMKNDPAGVEIAKGVWEGTIELVEA